MKKKIVLICAGLMIFGTLLIAGCGSSSSTTPGSGNNSGSGVSGSAN